MENVKGLVSMPINYQEKLLDKIVHDFQKIGYDVLYKVLNSKDFGIPQNRERIWFVCKLGKWEFMEFQFPESIPLKLKVKDLLEKEVDKKYYLSQKFIESLERRRHKEVPQPHLITEDVDTANTITTRSGNRYQDNFVNVDIQDNKKITTSRFGDNIFNGIPQVSPTLVHQGQSDVPIILLDPKKYQDERTVREFSDYSLTLLASNGTSKTSVLFRQGEYRRLTPREVFRLQGFLNDNIDLSGISDSQLYKLAGNGWEVEVASRIMKNLYKSIQKNESKKD